MALSSSFWRDPRVGWRRNMDYAMVAIAFTYATYCAFELPTIPWTLGWLLMLGAIACIFIANETRFWLNPSKTEVTVPTTECRLEP